MVLLVYNNTSGTPQGTNSNCSDVYSGSVFLDQLDWVGIMNRDWGGDPEKKRVKHAEVLVPDNVLLTGIEGISTRTQQKANEVNMLIKQYGLDQDVPGAMSRPDLYF